MENSQTIGAKLVALRKAKGVTQADLGTYLNISYQAVSKWERDESCPDFNTLSRIAQFFNVPIAYFESGNEETAYTATAAQATPAREMLGVCKDCGKVVYKGHGTQGDEGLLCESCIISQEQWRENKRKEAMEISAELSKTNKKRAKIRITLGFIFGFFAVLLIVAWMILRILNAPQEDIDFVVITNCCNMLLAFTFVSQLFWDGVIFEWFTEFCGNVWDGILEFSDSFVFFSIIVLLICLPIWLLLAIVALLVCSVISLFTFYPAYSRIKQESGKVNVWARAHSYSILFVSAGEKTIAVRKLIGKIMKLKEVIEEDELIDIIISKKGLIAFDLTKKKAQKIVEKFEAIGAKVIIKYKEA